MDGYEVARRLRSDPRTRDVIITMCTAKALATNKLLGLEAGADDCIVKPFDPLDLLERVRHVLETFDEMMALLEA